MSGNVIAQRLHEMVFAQPGAADRLALCRMTTGLAVARTVRHLPPSDFVAEYGRLLDRAEGRSTARATLTPATYDLLRVIAAVSSVGWSVGVENPAVKLAANISFALLQREVVRFHDRAWSYNSHLNVFLAALSIMDSSGDAADDELASVVLFLLQACFAWTYLQSGVSKLVGTGWRWADGRTLRGALTELGTPLGKHLSTADLRLARAASTATMAFEFSFVPLLLVFWRHRRLLGLGSAVFHGAVKATMDISFWHLSWFSVPLFVAPKRMTTWARRVQARGTVRRIAKSLTTKR
ncbi:hypothetical protein [Actinophytocola oryzae]|uniref:HTTM domain-containing protein n=1 Tax=Actinophytocola oryzae TaxID=502181 RepID=A0A4R7VH83_9PSEU|nr:hypothetical protein [Actinophytocola oryzae]TDV48694.1 hypothetical protein CLV71_10854 [Actinophytocola oryzae]